MLRATRNLLCCLCLVLSVTAAVALAGPPAETAEPQEPGLDTDLGAQLDESPVSTPDMSEPGDSGHSPSLGGDLLGPSEGLSDNPLQGGTLGDFVEEAPEEASGPVWPVAALAADLPAPLAAADRQHAAGNFKDAAEAYTSFLESVHPPEQLWHATVNQALCWLRLRAFDRALESAEAALARFAGTIREAHAHRLLGSFYLLVPHSGSFQGGKYLRGEMGDGEFHESTAADRDRAVEHLEKARDLYLAFQADPARQSALSSAERSELTTQRLGCQFDLVTALTRFSEYDTWLALPGKEPGKDDGTVGEEAESTEGLGMGHPWHRRGYRGPARLRAIPVDEAGAPRFATMPEAYSSALSLGQKVKFLLAEIERLDTTARRDDAALALYRRAMLARSRYAGPGSVGVEFLEPTQSDGTGQPATPASTAAAGELADNEVVTRVGSRVRRVQLPPDEDILGLLRAVVERCPQSIHAAEAQYSIGLYYQSRRQFRQAVTEYERVVERFPHSGRASQARHQLAFLVAPEVALDEEGVRPSGSPVRLGVQYRNTNRLRFTAYRVDLDRYLTEGMANLRSQLEDSDDDDLLQDPASSLLQQEGDSEQLRFRAYSGEPAARWESTVADSGDRRRTAAQLESPLTTAGLYVVEVTCAGQSEPSRSVVLVSDLALVLKRLPRQHLCLVVDPATGRPVPEARVHYFQYWNPADSEDSEDSERPNRKKRRRYLTASLEATTDSSGVALLTPSKSPDNPPQMFVVVRSPSGALAFLNLGSSYEPDELDTDLSGGWFAVWTDRPVYRPGQTVKYKAWIHTRQGNAYRPSTGKRLKVQVQDPGGNTAYQTVATVGAFGSLDGQFKLDATAPLGSYQLHVDTLGFGNGGSFRVEEYKKPEFEVTVKPRSDLARLGDPVEGTIEARYAFGGPVSNGRVTYRIFREEYVHHHAPPAPWDWLYGPGYGGWWYDYSWLPGWREFGPRPWLPLGQFHERSQRELVSEGSEALREDGTVPFRVDTAAARRDHPDRDHLYTIEAEVVDASRRLVKASGHLKVTRREFFAFVDVDRGYYQPGDPIRVEVRATTANELPVATRGKLELTALRYDGAGGGEVAAATVETQELATGADGNASVTMKVVRSGQYRLLYRTVDSSGQPIVASQVFWVSGPDFQGASYRYTGLEILPDRKTYAPGDTARLMINTSRAGAAVLFSHHAGEEVLKNYRVLVLTGKSAIVELPIAAGDAPNFFVEATVVVDGKVLQEARELLVPPQSHVLQVSLTPSKASYRPGEKGTIAIEAKTGDGRPAQAELALTAFDRAVLTFGHDNAPDLRSHYWGSRRSHSFWMMSSLQATFSGEGSVHAPEEQVESELEQAWTRIWGLLLPRFLRTSLGAAGQLTDAGDDPGGGVLSDASMELAPAADASGREKSGMAYSLRPEVNASRKVYSRAGGKGKLEGAGAADGAAEQPFEPAKVRSEFADTALWVPSVVTGADGKASVELTWPENLATWKVRAMGMTENAEAGDGSTAVITTKGLLVRLQAPRFFVERDRVVLSANVHSRLATDKKARVTLTVPEDLMELLSPATVEVALPAGKEARVDWEVAVRREGFAAVKMEALTDEESDAMQMGFPVLVHGLEKTVSKTGMLRPGGPDVAEVTLEVPAERRPEASRLEVRFSPSLAGALIDAVPYLLDYPYGCTEQTLSRFVPAVLVQKSLLGMGLSLDDLARERANLDSQQLGGTRLTRPTAQPLGDRPVFSQKELARIVRAGLDRLAAFQNQDGGWGWWAQDTTSVHLTALVVWGLQLASDNDVAVDGALLAGGRRALVDAVARAMKSLKKTAGASDEQAFAAYVLALTKASQKEFDSLLLARRQHLSLYGKALLSLALRLAARAEDADLVLQNIRQFEKRDPENQTAWFEVPADGWWWWWNSDVETQAWILKAILAKNPKDEHAPWMVKWLLNNRRNGTYWRSTRDTALAVSALVDFMRATRELEPDFTLRVLLDGKMLKEATLTRQNMLTLDNRISLAGEQLTTGSHTLRFERQGSGAAYFSAYLTCFTKEEGITSAGLEVKVERQYFKLTRSDRTATVPGARLQEVQERRLRYERALVKEGDRLASGDLLEVELRVTAKNDCEYLVFEDPKPAGCEPVEVRSGARYGELCSNLELRDTKLAFFASSLSRGEHVIRYRLRAEVPGTFHALPTRVWAMYAPELRANSAEAVLGIDEAR
jgi:hypothetical protein